MIGLLWDWEIKIKAEYDLLDEHDKSMVQTQNRNKEMLERSSIV